MIPPPSPFPPSNGVPTSDAAAEAIAPATPTIRAQLLELLRSRGSDGATANELERVTGHRPCTITPRLLELRRLGEVVDSGRVRPTAAGRAAIVWIARTDAAGS